MTYRLIRNKEARALTGHSQTSFYGQISDGTMTPPVKITGRSSAWPEDELIAINRARIAGKTDDEIRALVRELVAARAAA